MANLCVFFRLKYKNKKDSYFKYLGHTGLERSTDLPLQSNVSRCKARNTPHKRLLKRVSSTSLLLVPLVLFARIYSVYKLYMSTKSELHSKSRYEEYNRHLNQCKMLIDINYSIFSNECTFLPWSKGDSKKYIITVNLADFVTDQAVIKHCISHLLLRVQTN